MWPEKTLHFLHRRKKGLVCSGLQLAVFLFFEVAKIGYLLVATGKDFLAKSIDRAITQSDSKKTQKSQGTFCDVVRVNLGFDGDGGQLFMVFNKTSTPLYICM